MDNILWTWYVDATFVVYPDYKRQVGAIMIFAINLIGIINIVPFFMNLINEQSEIIPIF